MRAFATLCALGMVAGSLCQANWHHELLHQSAYGLDLNYTTSAVSVSGVPIYTTKVSESLSHVFRYKTDLNDLYINEPSHGIAFYINAAGQVAYYALTSNSYHMMVDGRDYFTERYGPTADYWPTPDGLDDTGRPLWDTAGPLSGYSLGHVFRGQEELSAGMQIDASKTWNMNRRGDCLWSAHLTTDPPTVHSELYLNGTDISRALLGDYAWIFGADVTDKGEVLWTGGGSATGMKARLFLGQQDITPGGLTYGGLTSWFRTNSGHNLWTQNLVTDQKILMRDNEDISTGAFGGDPFELKAYSNPGGLYINENGQVAWMARDRITGRWAAFRDRAELSGPVLGQWDLKTPDTLDVRGIDDAGDVLWCGSGSNTGHVSHVFVNNYDLTSDLYAPGTYFRSRAMAMGADGSVLWAVDDRQNWNVYLSTPVPEPSVLMLALPIAGVLIRKRPSR